MVSMKEIARSCGVSVATVSKALSDKPDISKPTRDRIRKVAEEMGYMLNASARALKTNRTYNIGVLFVDRMSAGLAHAQGQQTCGQRTVPRYCMFCLSSAPWLRHSAYTPSLQQLF